MKIIIVSDKTVSRPGDRSTESNKTSRHIINDLYTNISPYKLGITSE